jgi:hypothetical protein
MAWINPLYEEHQRKRWMRHDWHRWVRPGARSLLLPQEAKFRAPGAGERTTQFDLERGTLPADLQRLRWLVKDLKVDLAIRQLRLKYSPRPAAGRAREMDG